MSGRFERSVSVTPEFSTMSGWAMEDILQKYLTGGNLVVVGPSNKIIRDPTLYFLAQHFGPAAKIFIADPRSETEKPPLNGSYLPEVGPVVGIGNVDSYLNECSALEQAGAVLSPRVWLGPESGAGRIPVPEGALDGVIDHTTSIFLAARSGKRKQSVLSKFYREYHRVLAPGGIAVVAFNRSGYQAYFVNEERAGLDTGYIPRAIVEAGFEPDRITHFTDCREQYAIRLPETVIGMIRQYQGQGSAPDPETIGGGLGDFVSYAVGRGAGVDKDGPVLRLNQVFSRCTDVYLAVK